MWRGEIELRATGNDANRIDALVTTEIMSLDMVHVDGFGHTRRLVEIAQVAREVGKFDNAVAITLEVGVVNRVETDKGWE